MSAVQIVVDGAAIKAIKSSPEVAALIQHAVDKIADEANRGRSSDDGGFVGGVDKTAKGARGYVVTRNQHGMHAEALDRRLTRAVDAGR